MNKRKIANRVILAVSHVFCIDPTDLSTKSRLGPVVNGKKAIAYILRVNYDFTPEEIIFYTPEKEVSIAQVYRRIKDVTTMLQYNTLLIFKELLNTTLTLLDDRFLVGKVQQDLQSREYFYKKHGYKYYRESFNTEIQSRLQLKKLTRQQLAVRDNKLAAERFYPYLVFLNF